MADFEHFNIMDVDPSFKPIDAATYTLRVNKMTKQIVTPKSGKNEGVELPIVKGDFTVVESENFSGRRLFHTFWLDSGFDQKSLRKLADKTGVTQEPGESFSEWLEKLSMLQPTFKVPVTVEPEKGPGGVQKVDETTGKPIMKNTIVFKDIQVAN